MLKKKSKIALSVLFTIVIIIILIGHDFRLDRFGRSKISWVDCLQLNSTKYYSDFKKTSIEASLIDKKVGKIKFNVAGKVSNAEYRFRDGDATFLEVGTEVYSVKSDENAVAVKVGNQYYLYKEMPKK
jgi:hypothetical protein